MGKRTMYDALKRASIKYFGKWYSSVWDKITEETKEEIREKGMCAAQWDNLIHIFSSLWIGIGPNGNCFVNGTLSGCAYGEEYEDNVKRLKSVAVECKYWVYCYYCMDDNFSLRGYKEKKDAVSFLKSRSRDDDTYCVFLFRW